MAPIDSSIFSITARRPRGDHRAEEKVQLSEPESAFGAFLVEQNVIEAAVLDRACRATQKTGDRLDRVLTKLGLLSEADLIVALARYFSLPQITQTDLPSEPVLSDIIKPEFVRRNRVIPLALYADAIVVGITDPFNEEPVRALAYLVERPVRARLFAPPEFDKAFEALYGVADTKEELQGSATEASEVDVQRLRDMAGEAPVIRLVNQVIAGAVEGGASDIHLEPAEDAVLVRYRIDGALRTVRTLPAEMRAAVTSRLKIMSKLDIAERRLPQDGRINIAVRGVDIDIRVSTIPTAFGESIVLRILDRSQVLLDFAKLGFEPEHIEAIHQLIAHPNGIILVTGPTGSGKTTTLYTVLKALNAPDRKLFTVEDSIEYQLARINQVQVQPAIGFDFPHALRSILRQDPDIIMVGEIRDLETARIAVQASLTGHLVFSTLHTNSAAAAITRLVDMGVENFLLASTVRAVLAQRLVRRLCRHCAVEHDDADQWATEIAKKLRKADKLGRPSIRRPGKCAKCGHTGYAGRTTIAELMVVDAEIQRLVLSAAADTELERAARARGMDTMYETGMLKVWRGETTLEEVLKATTTN